MHRTDDSSLITTRRDFLRSSALGAGAAWAGAASAWQPQTALAAPAVRGGDRPNFLFILCDQLSLNAIAAHGCKDAHTPNLDRLVRRGVTFLESHSTNPVCSPARSSLFTGRMPVETGVIQNNLPIHPSCPNTGQWLARAGYESYYCGKWHLPEGYPTQIKGFTILPAGKGQGDLVDSVVSRWAEAFLKNRRSKAPFLLVASLLQPHDICYWAIRPNLLVPGQLPFARIADRLPELPPNHHSNPKAPAALASKTYKGFSEDQWRYYLYIYYRQVEMVDAQIGRMLDALEESGRDRDTIVMFTADHGEGGGRHMHVQKWYPYDEALKVPMIVSCPGRMAEGLLDRTHLVSGLDVIATMCDYAGIAPPPKCRGLSLRPLLEQRPAQWREFVGAEYQLRGRVLRTERFKYTRFEGDPIEQLFDMQADPWEMTNLCDDPQYAGSMAEHRKLLDRWEASLEPVTPPPRPVPAKRRPLSNRRVP